MYSQRDPYQHNDHIHALGLTTVVLVAPHAVRLLVPVGAGSAVHAATANVRLSVRSGRRGCGGGLGGRSVLALLGRRTSRRALGLVELSGGHQVLDDGAVDSELEGRCGGFLWGGLGDHSLKDVVLWWWDGGRSEEDDGDEVGVVWTQLTMIVPFHWAVFAWS